jgi:hypothetical protein
VHTPEATREHLLNSFWKFECPVHGLLFEKPLQVNESRFVPRDRLCVWLMRRFD